MDLTTRERAACREEFGASFDRMPDHPNVLTFARGYRAALAASPSEEGALLDLLEAEGGHHIEITSMDDHSYDVEVHRLDEDGEPEQIWKANGLDRRAALTHLLAALRTTKEGEQV